MTAKKASLLIRGVLIEDFQDTRALLSPENINQTELLNYAKDAARWITGLDNDLKFALNHYGNADVAMFDFTSMTAAENACRVKEIYLRSKCCKKINNASNSVSNGSGIKNDLLLLHLVGDSLLEPFWPTGSGCGRGFLSSFDAAWMCRQYAIKCLNNSTKNLKENEENILSVISERESIYRLLAQTKSENLNSNLNHYTLNPITRYPNLNLLTIMPSQCKHLLYSNVRKIQPKLKQTLAEKRLRRITIACTPDTFKQQFIKQQHQQQEIEESPEEESSSCFNNENRIEIGNSNGDKQTAKLTGSEYLAKNKEYMTPSAFNLASIELATNKEIESVIKHRKQREERMHQESISSEERFMNHIRKQIKPKANWFLNTKTENSYESNTSSNRSNNSSQEDLHQQHQHQHQHYSTTAHHRFSNKVKDLEFKLNKHNIFNEERYLNQKSSKHVDGVNVNLARLTLQDLLDPIKQEAKFKEEVKRKAFLEKDYKFVGKLTKDDWNVKLFNDNNSEESDKLSDRDRSLKPRPKERLAIFKEKLQNIENVLTNGKLKTDDEINKLTRKQLQKFEIRSKNRCGEWIEKLKSELTDKQQSNAHKKFNSINSNKPLFLRKRPSSIEKTTVSPVLKSVAEKNKTTKSVTDGYSNSFSYLNKNPNVEYIKYERLNKPIVSLKNETTTKFHSLDRLKLDNNNRLDEFNQFNTYAKDNCARCESKIMTIDKVNLNGVLFHRNCLKCANCGINLRLNEVRHANNILDDLKNCICTLCSNETRLLLTRSNSTSNYSTRLKERMKFKEMFLLNLDCQDNNNEKNANQINERVEYENAFENNELLDEELLNLTNSNSNKDDVCCSKSSPSQSSDILLLDDKEEENEEDEETTSDESTFDTTGQDVCSSDQFDEQLSELESSPKNEKLKNELTNKPKLVPEIQIINEEINNSLSEEDEQTLNNNMNSNMNNTNNISNATTNSTNSTIENDKRNDLSDKHKQIRQADISEIDEYDEYNELTNEDELNKKNNGFKVEIQYFKKLNQPVLKENQNESSSTNKLTYNGSFTEKVMKCRSSPSLFQN